MVVQAKLYTVEEYLAFCRLPENAERRLELVEGEIVELASSSKKNTVIAARIAYYLNTCVIPADLGYVSGADGGFQLGARTVRLPDTAFISKERAGGLEGAVLSGAPDLAVEVISDSETPREVLDKARAYLEAGAALVWTVYPDAQVVDVYRLTRDSSMIVDTVGAGGTLSGAPALPGFTLPLADLFR